ncbi:uncharacterized protein LOC131933197 [Physella acuta]|uniref:uncharacterized protein LOC131933197 n=1 Tax=Physella acuta TaxID=109671 RepID=UPI0027DD7297|nr:uncharacterized protein LOC131933197 [Physella acuta]
MDLNKHQEKKFQICRIVISTTSFICSAIALSIVVRDLKNLYTKLEKHTDTMECSNCQDNLFHKFDGKTKPVHAATTENLITPVTAHVSITQGLKHQDLSFSKNHVDLEINLHSPANHFRGVVIHENKIIILHSGLYYLYSSIDFKPNSTKSSKDFTYQTWFHYVHKSNINNPHRSGVLLRTVHTCCPDCVDSRETAYTGGAFYLEAGDTIQSCVSVQGVVSVDDRSSFLGLVMLNSQESTADEVP